MTKHTEWLIVGIISSPHGIQGKLNVIPQSDFHERFTKPGMRWLQKDNEEPLSYRLVSGFQKPGKKSFIISLKEVKTRNEAENLKRYKILVKSNDIPKLQKGEFHISEILGMEVKLQNQSEIIGEVCDFIGENNKLLVVKLFKKNKNVLIPFVKEIIPNIHDDDKYFIINPPEGLFDL